jgi:hypothetical protein
MFRMWIRGDRGPSAFYAGLLGAAFGVPFAEGKPGGGDIAPGAAAGQPPYDGTTGPDGAADIDLGQLWWGPDGMPAAMEGMVAAMERRQFLELTGGALTGAAHQWMVADPARIAAVLPAGLGVDTTPPGDRMPATAARSTPYTLARR